MSCPICHAENARDAQFCHACGASLRSNAALNSDALPAETRLHGGDFVVEGVLGQGGFGITYRGRDERLRRAVAIKEFFPFGCKREGRSVTPAGPLTSADYSEARAKFIEEAQVLARFGHPGIVQVYTGFEENNTAYMAMELLEGRSLTQLVEERGALPQAEALSIIEAVGAALQEVHRAGLLHRDIKPDNILVCAQPAASPRTVLIDFGTAREFASGKTRHMTTTLTPGYAPLEQYGLHARFGAFSDIYSLGATLYFLLTGEMPFPATDRVSGLELRPPHEINQQVSQNVSLATMRALEIKTGARPQSVGDFLASLHAASSSTALAPSFSTLPARAPDISSALAPLWPLRCACCNEPSDTALRIIYPHSGQISKETRTWDVPYCSACVRHVEAGGFLDWIPTRTAVPILLSFFPAVIFCSAVESTLPFLTWLIGSVCAGVGPPIYWDKRARALTKIGCSNHRAAVQVEYHAGDKGYTFHFENSDYAEAFQQLNTREIK